MLSVRDLNAGYGGKSVLHGVSLEVPRGMIVTLLGANGAGKSTLLKTIVGLLPRTAGTIELDAVPLTNATPDRALKAGVALVPEQRELFREMSVLDNLRLGAFLRRGTRRDRRRLRAASGCLSDSPSAGVATGTNPVGWRTADACHCACVDEPSLVPAAGRAVARIGAENCRRDFRNHWADQRRRHRGPPG